VTPIKRGTAKRTGRGGTSERLLPWAVLAMAGFLTAAELLLQADKGLVGWAIIAVFSGFGYATALIAFRVDRQRRHSAHIRETP
jgi:hypothetical protein